MKKEIKAKMDEHIKQILEKPSITAEDYSLLEHELCKMPSDGWGDPFWMMILMTILFGFGGKKDEL